MNRIPGKVAHRKAATKADLLSLLVEREIGYCDADKTAYIRIGSELHPLGGGRIDKPTTTSLLMGFLEDAETYTYDWKSLEYLEPIPYNPLKLWSRLAGMGLYAEVAHMDSKGRDISEQLNYASVLVAVFDETDYAILADAVSQGKSVILSIGNTQFAYLYSVSEDAYIFRTLISGEHTYTEYAVGPDDIWNARTVDIGESTPVLNSNKLLTSGGAYDALKEKADVHRTTPGTFPKVSVNEQGIVTEGLPLDADDIPEHSADKLTRGYLNPNRLEDGSIPAEKLEIRKKLMVDGTTIGVTETQDAVVLRAIASDGVIQGSDKPVSSGAVYSALHSGKGAGWFTSSDITTEGGESIVVQSMFAIAPDTEILGTPIEFVPVETHDTVVFGNIYLNPGIYLVSYTINARWGDDPINKVCNVMGHPFDFTYAHDEKLTSVSLRRITERTRIDINIALDDDTPTGLQLRADRLEICTICL